MQADHDSADGFAAAAVGVTEKIWVITNEDLRREISRQLPRLVIADHRRTNRKKHSTGDWTRGLSFIEMMPMP